MLKNEIREAFTNQEFELYYQPLVNRQRHIVSYEILSRWRRKGELLSPSCYMDELEREGFAETLFFYNIDKLAASMSAGLIKHPAAVNAPSFIVEKKRFPRRVLEVFADKGLDASLLKLRLVANVNGTIEAVSKELGLKIIHIEISSRFNVLAI